MKLYINPGSGSACVEAILAELELSYERVAVQYGEDGISDPDFKTINPRKQIPTIVFDNGETLTETFAILSYLADSHPDSELAPKRGTFARAKLDQWMSFIVANIYEGELRKNYPHRYVINDSTEVEEVAWDFVLQNYAILEQACSNDGFFFGSNLTILDVYIWMFINWFEEFEDLEKVCPKLISIAEQVMNRTKIKPIHIRNFGEGLGWTDQS